MTFPNWRFGWDDLKRVKDVLATNFSASNPSDMCKQLERLWAEKIGAKHAVTFTSGTATLHACLEAVEIKHGNEVIVPALGPIMPTNSVVYQNAIPVFADVQEDTFNIDPEDIENKVTARTKAIMPISLYGLPPDMDRILEIAEKHELAVIEDNAESPGALYKGRNLGTIGDVASFSFESSKHFVTGDGGIVTTNDETLAERVRAFGNHGFKIGLRKAKNAKNTFQDPDYKRHESFGWAYRMPEVACAIAISQVERFDEIVELRCEIAKLCAEVVEGCDFIIPQFIPKGYKNVYWTYAVKFEKSKAEWRKFRKMYLKNGGDGFYACWSVPYFEPSYDSFSFLIRIPQRSLPLLSYPNMCPVAEKVQPKIMQFPTNYGNVEEAKPKIEALRKTIKEFS